MIILFDYLSATPSTGNRAGKSRQGPFDKTGLICPRRLHPLTLGISGLGVVNLGVGNLGVGDTGPRKLGGRNLGG